MADRIMNLLNSNNDLSWVFKKRYPVDGARLQVYIREILR